MEIKIVSGPSLKELFSTAKFYKDSKETKFRITIDPDGDDPPFTEEVFARVSSITVKNSYEEVWNTELEFSRAALPAAVRPFLSVAVRSAYSTKKRVGSIHPIGPSITDIEDIEMSVRLTNTLKRAGIFYLEKITKEWTKAEIRKLRGIGEDSFNELVSILKERGISFKKD